MKRVKAPSSTANLGPGFDVFGLALDAFYDIVEIEVRGEKIRMEVRGEGVNSIPVEPESNSAGLAVSRICNDYRIKDGLNIIVHKSVPAGYGLGSSAASAAAAVKAMDLLYSLNLDNTSLVRYAAMGEIASAGAMHYDNVAASLLGGFVLVRSEPELRIVRIMPPEELALCIAIPKISVPKKKTEVARSVLPTSVSLKQVTWNVSNASMMVAGFMLKDISMIADSIRDSIVEPARAHLIPAYSNVKKRAMDAGALAVTISGAGPSMIAFLNEREQDPRKICDAMREGFMSENITCYVAKCKPDLGAREVEST